MRARRLWPCSRRLEVKIPRLVWVAEVVNLLDVFLVALFHDDLALPCGRLDAPQFTTLLEICRECRRARPCRTCQMRRVQHRPLEDRPLAPSEDKTRCWRSHHRRTLIER